jgi:hypothetical protein
MPIEEHTLSLSTPPFPETTVVHTAYGLPYGLIPRVEPTQTHAELIDAIVPERVMLRIDHARRLARQNQTAATAFPEETTVITTTTIPDAKLATITREHELEILTTFEPDYHIPADHPTYRDQSSEDRRTQIARYCSGTRWIWDRLRRNPDAFSTSPPILLPLIKGTTPSERALTYELAVELQAPIAFYYAVQYFTEGNRIAALVEDLTEIHANSPPTLPLGLIGLLGPDYLSRCPNSVAAASGLNGWRSSLTVTDTNSTLKRQYHHIAARVQQELAGPSTGQA